MYVRLQDAQKFVSEKAFFASHYFRILTVSMCYVNNTYVVHFHYDLRNTSVNTETLKYLLTTRGNVPLTLAGRGIASVQYVLVITVKHRKAQWNNCLHKTIIGRD